VRENDQKSLIKTGTVSHDAASSPGDDEIKQSNFMAAPHDASATPGDE
jgi:hypothetical protein